MVCGAVWVAEWGRFDLRKIAEGGEEMRKSFRKYVQKAERIIAQSIEVPENELKEMNVILDFDGFSVNQLLSVPSKSTFSSTLIIEKH